MRFLGFCVAAVLAAMLVAFAPGQVSAGLLDSAKSSNPQRHGVVAAVCQRKAGEPERDADGRHAPENPDLPAYVPGGHPQNPLGVRALYLGKSLYRIHGTDAPWSVGKAVYHGCIRIFNQDVADLYQRAPVATQVDVTW